MYVSFCWRTPSSPHLGPLSVLNSKASWPKGSIFSSVSPVQALDRVTHSYSSCKHDAHIFSNKHTQKQNYRKQKTKGWLLKIWTMYFKGIVHTKMKIQSLITNIHVVLHCITFFWIQNKIFDSWSTVFESQWSPKQQQKYLNLKTILMWGNYDNVIFVWTVPLRIPACLI